MDVLAPTTMKNAAKCDTSCELQNPVSHQNFERILHFPWEVCLLECLFIPTQEVFFLRDGRLITPVIDRAEMKNIRNSRTIDCTRCLFREDD